MTDRALAPFLALAPALRAAGFPAAPEQVQTFLAAVGLLGPRGFGDVRSAAVAVFGPGPERRAEFDAVLDAVFLGRTLAAPAAAEGEDDRAVFDAGGLDLAPEVGEDAPSGAEATAAERLTARAFAAGEEEGLRAFARAAPAALPQRRSRRWTGGRGPRPDPRRAFRQMLERDGEVTRLPARARRVRQRRVLFLIDVSGSMKAGTAGAMRLAHALVQAGERVEVFTLGTRLTRVTRALRHRDRDRALAFAAGLVADWDGGTRLGEAMGAFLAVPRFAACARGAFAVILSDGLERGGPDALVAAMARLRGLAWGVLWLNPLAADPAYRPEAAAMAAVLPMLDRLGAGDAPRAVAREILSFARGAR